MRAIFILTCALAAPAAVSSSQEPIPGPLTQGRGGQAAGAQAAAPIRSAEADRLQRGAAEIEILADDLFEETAARARPVLTHGHGDHVTGAKSLQDTYKPRVILGAADWDMMENNKL